MVTLKQLAKELNLSVSTVSKALNDSREISDLTIQRVKEAAALRRYKPNKIASSLRTSSTKTIGVVIPDILNPFFAHVLFGIEQEAANLGYNIITSLSNESLKQELSSLQFLANGSVDGFIISASKETQEKEETTHYTQILNEGYALVMFDRVVHNLECDKVIINDFKTAYDITKHLLSKENKKVAFFTRVDHLKIGILRKNGFLRAYAEFTDEVPQILVLNEEDDCQKKIRDFLKKYPETNAIFAADNVTGTIAVNMAVFMGLNVPKDISVIGFADANRSVLSVPPLSTVDQRAKEMGIETVRMLVNRLRYIKNEETVPPITKTLETTLIKRGTS